LYSGGEGPGVRGRVSFAMEYFFCKRCPTPHPQPLSPEYRGEGRTTRRGVTLMAQTCPPPERWKEHLDGSLSVEEQAVLTEHLDGCPPCRKTLETLAAGGDSLLDVARQAGEVTDASSAPE